MLCLFIEGAIVGPPDRVWPAARAGTGLLAMRADMPIVPVALVGSNELYRGRRIAVRVLAETSVGELLGTATLPAAGSREELHAARSLARALAARIDAELPPMLRGVADPPTKVRRWRWLTRLMR